MGRVSTLAFGILAAFGCETDAVLLQDRALSTMRVLSKAEIRATMTAERAVSLATSSKRLSSQPGLMALLKDLQMHNSSQAATTTAAPTGYSAVDGARKMLNEMMKDAETKLDNEVETCGTFNRDTLAQLEEVRQDVASFNSQAAEARSRVLKSQSVISFVNLKLPQVQQELEQHNKECANEQASINAQIGVVAADLKVMASILDMIGDCSEKKMFLVQCSHCRKSDGSGGYVMLQNDALRPLVEQLQTSEARKVMQQALGEEYQAAATEDEPVALAQFEVRKLRGRADPTTTTTSTEPKEPEGDAAALNIAEVPKETKPVDCVPTNKCTLGAGNCPKIRDRFLNINAGIQDLFDKLKQDLAELQKTCEDTRKTLESQVANLGEKLRSAQTDLGVATKDQVDSESSSNLKAQQHAQVSKEYGKTMKECCDEQNDLKSEICALEKIRGEMMKLKGKDIFITDCEVSDFKAGECSASCGGGTVKKTRSVLVHPVNGMECPPLEMVESCNTEPCPVDCVVGDWEGWSGCSAECGGGVRERMRPVLQAMKNDGAPCEDTEESEGCNAQSCNADCELAEWSDWGACSQACLGGTSRRERAIAVAATGNGKCKPADDGSRLTFRSCNRQSCAAFKQSDGFLKCDTKLDLIILMDGSGSLGQLGWKQSQIFVQNLLNHLTDNVRVAVQVFSGPRTWSQYERCIGAVKEAPDMEKDCNIKWVTHMTSEFSKAADAVKSLPFPEATTLTSVALAEAEAEIVNGREDALTTVLVVTDGKPLSQQRTMAAAERLMEKARVVWVPVGSGAPMDLIKDLASLPKKENIIRLPQFYQLNWKVSVNRVIKSTCPDLVAR